jgi:dolichol-phosphate mannosyltransferase
MVFFSITRNCFYDLHLEKIRNDYVFETSLLNELSMKNKIVAQVDGPIIYNHQSTSLRPIHMILPLLSFHMSACLKRVLVKYFLREFNVGTFFLVTGMISAIWAVIIAHDGYMQASITKHPAASGIVGMSVLFSIIAYISFVAFIFYDMSSNPNRKNYQRIISWLYKNEKNSSSNRG